MTTKKEIIENETCPAQGLLKLLSGKWKPEIFRLAVEAPLRFSSLLCVSLKDKTPIMEIPP